MRQPPSPSRKELVEPRHQAARSRGGDKGPFVPPSPRGQGGAGPWRQAAPGTRGEERDWQVGAWTLGGQGPVSRARSRGRRHRSTLVSTQQPRGAGDRVGAGGRAEGVEQGHPRSEVPASKVRMAAANCR